MCEWFSQFLHNWKHPRDLHEKAWRHLRVKKHEADMIYDEARMRRFELLGEADNEARSRWFELFGEADTSTHPAVEPTTDDGGIGDFALLAKNFSEDSEASEQVASCELAEPIVDATDEEAKCRSNLGLSWRTEATEPKQIGVHTVAGRRSAHQAATCVRTRLESWTLIHGAVRWP